MKTLEEIKSFGKEYELYESQYNKFVEFINNNDELSAWQTVLGNINWLQSKGLDIDINDVITKADGIAKTWYKNGQLGREYRVNKNGNRDGVYRSYYNNGELEVECAYKNGVRDGLYRLWRSNGQLYIECVYKNGVRIK